jgi:hypothetical protein
MAVLKHVSHTPRIDMREWFFGYDAEKKLHGCILAEVSELVRVVWEENPPRISFPFEWGFESDGNGGPGVVDPATVYVELTLSPSDDACCYSVSLKAVVDELIEDHRAGGDGPLDDEGKAVVTKLAGRLRELADRLDSAARA